MYVNNTNTCSNTSFKAKLSPELLKDATRCAKNSMQKDFLAKRIKEIETYGDKNSEIHAGIGWGGNFVMHVKNPVLPKHGYSPKLVRTPLVQPRDSAFAYALQDTGEWANSYDLVTIITPERVHECEKAFFLDTVKNLKLDPNKTLEECKNKVAPDTYKAFQEAVIEKDTHKRNRF